jgi:CheY-like chemotaxis protein
MDLAMPGIDGWETIRRMRREGLNAAPVAIVSANAFDQALENDVGIGAADFIVKPVRLQEMLDWLGDRLALQWTAAPAAAAGPPPPVVLPPPAQLRALAELVQLGYYRGIVSQLDRIASGGAAYAPFVERMRSLARDFRFDAMAGCIEEGLK